MRLCCLASFACCRPPARCPPECHAFLLAQTQLTKAGFAAPSWEADPPHSAHASDHAGPTLRGWQAPAAEAVSRQLQGEVLAQTDPASQALLFLQTRPYSSPVFTSVPSCPEPAYSPSLFRVPLLQPLPFAARSCRCDRLSTLSATIGAIASRPSRRSLCSLPLVRCLAQSRLPSRARCCAGLPRGRRTRQMPPSTARTTGALKSLLITSPYE